MASKTLTLPQLVLREEGVEQTVFSAGSYRFDEVLPEYSLGAFQPDALVRINGNELAVEFLVHHAVDAEKRGRVQLRDISMVEIDLSALKAGQVEGEELDAAILHHSPRSWVYHRKAAAAQRKLDSAVEAKRADRAARLKGHILRARRGRPPDGWFDEATAAVRRTGLEALTGVGADGGHWFTVPDRVWQAQALYVHLIEPSETYSPGGKNLEVRGDYPNERDFSSKLPDWMIRTDLSNYPVKRLNEAGFTQETYGSPHSAVWSYLATLFTMGQAVFWDREEQKFFIEPELQHRIHRRCELHGVVTRLLRAAKVEDDQAFYRAWAQSYCIGDTTAAHLAEVGGDAYCELISRLVKLQSMASGYTPTVVNDLCDLPLEAIRQRNIDLLAAEEVKKAAMFEEAKAKRISWIRAQAREALQEEAQAWLAQRVKGNEINFLDFAGESEENLSRAQNQLCRDADARRLRIASERQLSELRNRLETAAMAAFPNQQLADLFLKSGHPRLGGARPIDYCHGQHDYKLIVSLMPKKR